ncbi:hypothetical protein GCM10023198_02060 [Promicromonospora umidemergens]|uniref:Secreted protein n=1 Tax=Promicromonospora umidemergens TaxID=629679 RepID=A0ABP8WDC3_9MICO
MAPAITVVAAVVSGVRPRDPVRGAYSGCGRLLPDRCVHVPAMVAGLARPVVCGVQMDAAQDLQAQDGEHDENDRQDARRLSPRIGELRANGTCQGHSVPNSNGMDTVLGNTPP